MFTSILCPSELLYIIYFRVMISWWLWTSMVASFSFHGGQLGTQGRHWCRRWRWWFKAVARHGGKQPASQGDSPINLHTRSRTQYCTVNCQSLFTHAALYPTGWTLNTWFLFSGRICTEVCSAKFKGAVECSESHGNVMQCNVLQGVSKKRNFSDFRLVYVLDVGFYFFTCDLESESWAHFI